MAAVKLSSGIVGPLGACWNPMRRCIVRQGLEACTICALWLLVIGLRHNYWRVLLMGPSCCA
jgi:hypothetical protein